MEVCINETIDNFLKDITTFDFWSEISKLLNIKYEKVQKIISEAQLVLATTFFESCPRCEEKTYEKFESYGTCHGCNFNNIEGYIWEKKRGNI